MTIVDFVLTFWVKYMMVISSCFSYSGDMQLMLQAFQQNRKIVYHNNDTFYQRKNKSM